MAKFSVVPASTKVSVGYFDTDTGKFHMSEWEKSPLEKFGSCFTKVAIVVVMAVVGFACAWLCVIPVLMQ